MHLYFCCQWELLEENIWYLLIVSLQLQTQHCCLAPLGRFSASAHPSAQNAIVSAENCVLQQAVWIVMERKSLLFIFTPASCDRFFSRIPPKERKS